MKIGKGREGSPSVGDSAACAGRVSSPCWPGLSHCLERVPQGKPEMAAWERAEPLCLWALLVGTLGLGTDLDVGKG